MVMKKNSNKFSAFWKRTKKGMSVKWRRFKRKVSKFFTPRRKKNILVVSLNLLGMLAVAFLVPYLTLLWIDDYTKHGEVCEVPMVCGKTLAEAERILKEHKLDYKIIERKYKEKCKKNEVLEQYPRGPINGSDGKRHVKYVKEGRKIALVVNTAEKPKKNIPNVIEGSSYRDAVHRLKGSGFEIEGVDTIKGDRDWVYGLKYNGEDLTNGMAVPQGAKLRIVIGGNVRSAQKDTVVVDHSYFE